MQNFFDWVGGIFNANFANGMRIFLIGFGVFCWGDDNLVGGIFLMRISRMGCEFFILIGLGVFCWGDDNLVSGIF